MSWLGHVEPLEFVAQAGLAWTSCGKDLYNCHSVVLNFHCNAFIPLAPYSHSNTCASPVAGPVQQQQSLV